MNATEYLRSLIEGQKVSSIQVQLSELQLLQRMQEAEVERDAAHAEIEQLREQNTELDAACAKLEADAERYRWLRDPTNQMHEDDISVSDSSFNAYFENDLDVAVDAGIERGKGLPDLGASTNMKRGET